MASNYDKLGDAALVDAFKSLMDVVVIMRDAGVPLSDVRHAPTFTYLMTPKQFDRIRRICIQKGWDVPNRRGILIDLDKPKHAQGIVFNTGRKVQVGKAKYYAVAVVKVCVEGGEKRLAPVTAYHATEAKIRSIS